MQTTIPAQAPAAQADQMLPPLVQMMQMVTAYWVSQSIYAAADLRFYNRFLVHPPHPTPLG